jgi:hypothetical protein
MESKNERFKRIATKRTIDIIEKIRILGNTSNKSTYSYNEDEINKIFRTIEAELKKQKAKFKVTAKEFSL